VIQRRPRPSILPAALLALAALLTPSLSLADGDAPEALFQRGAEALKKGEFAAAIDTFEALADQGFVHPDASYDRGLAYVTRVRARAERPGDLGRAAAAFSEALLLRPDDRDADAALDAVRAEVTRRRSRRSKDAIDARPTLDRMLVGLASEETWSLAALLASVLLATGLVLARRPAEGAAPSPSRTPAQVAGGVLVPLAIAALLVLVPLTLGARWLRVNTRPGVVIASEVYLTDDGGRAKGGEPVPEAASVETGERRGGLVHIRWGATEGWAPAASVRLLGAP
jgi:hypothetical protein